MWKKEHQSGFCRSWHFGRSGVEKSVQKAFKTVRKRSGVKKAFWSGNSRSGVLFLLNLAKFICIYIINKCIYIYTPSYSIIYALHSIFEESASRSVRNRFELRGCLGRYHEDFVAFTNRMKSQFNDWPDYGTNWCPRLKEGGCVEVEAGGRLRCLFDLTLGNWSAIPYFQTNR